MPPEVGVQSEEWVRLTDVYIKVDPWGRRYVQADFEADSWRGRLETRDSKISDALFAHHRTGVLIEGSPVWVQKRYAIYCDPIRVEFPCDPLLLMMEGIITTDRS